MTINKVSISKIEKWLKNGFITSNDNMYVISSVDYCRAIENIKKTGDIPQNLTQSCDNICNCVLSIEMRKKDLVDALYDEDFYANHVSKNQNGLSLASYICLYYQDYFPEERDSFVEDIEF